MAVGFKSLSPEKQAFGTNHQEARENAELRARLEWWVESTNERSSAMGRHGYTLDGTDRRTKATRENDQRWDYDYDTLGQVTSAVKKFPDSAAIPGHTFSYQFDGIGNRTSAVHGGTGTALTGTGVTYTPNELNQYETIATQGGRFILGEVNHGSQK